MSTISSNHRAGPQQTEAATQTAQAGQGKQPNPPGHDAMVRAQAEARAQAQRAEAEAEQRRIAREAEAEQRRIEKAARESEEASREAAASRAWALQTLIAEKAQTEARLKNPVAVAANASLVLGSGPAMPTLPSTPEPAPIDAPLTGDLARAVDLAAHRVLQDLAEVTMKLAPGHPPIDLTPPANLPLFSPSDIEAALATCPLNGHDDPDSANPFRGMGYAIGVNINAPMEPKLVDGVIKNMQPTSLFIILPVDQVNELFNVNSDIPFGERWSAVVDGMSLFLAHNYQYPLGSKNISSGPAAVVSWKALEAGRGLSYGFDIPGLGRGTLFSNVRVGTPLPADGTGTVSLNFGIVINAPGLPGFIGRTTSGIGKGLMVAGKGGLGTMLPAAAWLAQRGGKLGILTAGLMMALPALAIGTGKLLDMTGNLFSNKNVSILLGGGYRIEALFENFEFQGFYWRGELVQPEVVVADIMRMQAEDNRPQVNLCANHGFEILAKDNYQRQFDNGASPWDVAMGSNNLNHGNDVVDIANRTNHVLWQNEVLSRHKAIRNNTEAGVMLRELQRTLAEDREHGAEKWDRALTTLSNPYGLDFGIEEIAQRNLALVQDKPDNYAAVRDIFQGGNRFKEDLSRPLFSRGSEQGDGLGWRKPKPLDEDALIAALAPTPAERFDTATRRVRGGARAENNGDAALAAASYARELEAGISPWKVAQTSGGLNHGNSTVAVANKVLFQLKKDKFLDPSETILNSAFAGAVVDQYAGELDPISRIQAMDSMANDYNLNFGSKELDAANKRRAAREGGDARKPGDFQRVRDDYDDGAYRELIRPKHPG